MEVDFLVLLADDRPPRTIIACFECDWAGIKPDQYTINPEVIDPMEQEALIARIISVAMNASS